MILNETQKRSITRDYSTETSNYSDYISVYFLLCGLWSLVSRLSSLVSGDVFPWTHLIFYRFKLVGYTTKEAWV